MEAYERVHAPIPQPAVRRFRVTLRPGEDGWLVAECPELEGCVSQGRTRDEALESVSEAIEVCLEADGTAEPFELEVETPSDR